MLLAFRICEAQNLVPNGDFEQYYGCPDNFSQIDSCLFWMNPSTNQIWTGSPDYYNQCAFSSNVSVPNNLLGFQAAHSGGAYSGIFLIRIDANVREYIEVPLIQTLISNTCYHFEMYVNLANNCEYTSDDIGVYFSDTAITGINNYLPLPFNQHIDNVTGNVFDTLNWTLVSGNYTATGGENYLIIGNFKYDSLTSFILINSSGSHPSAYCYIDDVSLSICTGIDEQNENYGINIFPNPMTYTLNATVKNTELLEIILYDITSRKIFNQSFTNSTSISTEQLAKGIYLYEVRNKNGVIKKGKIVKD